MMILRRIAPPLLLAVLAACASHPPADERTPGSNTDDLLGISFVPEADGYRIRNRYVSLRVGWDAEGRYRILSLVHVPSGTEWASDAGNPELELELPGGPVSGIRRNADFECLGTNHAGPFGSVHGSRERWGTGMQAYTYFLHRPSSLRFIVGWTLFYDAPVLERWIVVENAGTAPISGIARVPSLLMTVRPAWEGASAPDPGKSGPEGPPHPALVLHSVSGLNGGLDDPSPPDRYASFTRQSRPVDKPVRIVSSPRSSATAIPWFALEDPATGNGLFGGLEWSGAWELEVGPAGGAGLLSRPPQAGESAGDSGESPLRVRWTTTANAWTLKPGESFEAPRAFVGCFAGGLDAERQALHDFVRRQLAPVRQPAWPWVQDNTWYSYGLAYDEKVLRAEADAAAKAGCEVLYIDAGWYLGSPPDGDFATGLGTWREEPAKFPSGLRAFSDYVRARGMRFGLWVEPERVDVGAQAAGGWQREWLVESGDPAFGAKADRQMPCFGHKPVREWAKETLGRVVETYGVDWLKWDNNMWMVCKAAHHTHPEGQGEYEQILGVYEVMDDLRQRFPNLAIENCAGGGNRMDFGILQHTDAAWVSDWSEPARRVRHHFLGANEAFPAHYLNSWVLNSDGNETTLPSLPVDLIQYVFRSRMPGALGISFPLREWPDEALAVVRAEVDTYKRLRPFIRDGRCIHLTPQPRLHQPDRLLVPPEDGWTAVQYHDPDQGTGAVLAYRTQGKTDAWSVRPAALDPAASYVVRVDGAESTRTGADLMKDGIPLATKNPKAAWVIFYAPESKVTRAPDFVTRWRVCGPFENDGQNGIDRRYIPEPSVDPAATFPGKGGAKAAWVEHAGREALLDFGTLWPKMEHAVAYAACAVYSPAARRATAFLGSDDSVKVWCNGKEVWRHEVYRAPFADEDRFPVDLAAGWNTFLVKVDQGGGGWGLYFRMADEAGRPIKDLKVDVEHSK